MNPKNNGIVLWFVIPDEKAPASGEKDLSIKTLASNVGIIRH